MVAIIGIDLEGGKMKQRYIIKCLNCQKNKRFFDRWQKMRKYCSPECRIQAQNRRNWPKYYLENKEKILIKNRKWAKTPQAKEYSKKYREAHKKKK